MDENVLKGKDIDSVTIYYENVRFMDKDGNQYFIKIGDLLEIIQEKDFQKNFKRTRMWVQPIQTKDNVQQLTRDDYTKLKKLLNWFEEITVEETGTKNISGGFAVAELSGFNNDWIYINLKWGVQNDVDNDTHEEHWKVPRYIFHQEDNVKKILQNTYECN